MADLKQIQRTAQNLARKVLSERKAGGPAGAAQRVQQQTPRPRLGVPPAGRPRPAGRPAAGRRMPAQAPTRPQAAPATRNLSFQGLGAGAPGAPGAAGEPKIVFNIS